jgi:hypothetical protein
MSEEDGTYLRYIERRFNPASIARLGQANQIIAEYEKQGLTLTLRQLYYQHVARGFIPNSQASYDSLGALISDGRMAGLVSWTAIEDRTRNLRGVETYANPAALIRSAVSDYRRDLWVDQDWRPEVWIEKDALVGVIQQICVELRVDFFACRGYNSQSEQWRAGQRFARYVDKGQRPIVFHLGDHDPSGLDMTRDNRERLSLFAGVPVTVARLALNWDQIQKYTPPPNPTKMTDVRAPGYVAAYGHQSWELDALDPKVIRDLINDAVAKIRDPGKWSVALAREAADRDRLDRVVEELTL